MIVRTYGRRTRCLGRSFCDSGGVAVDGDLGGGGGAEGEVDFLDFPLSQDSSQDRLAAFSSQDSSPWSLDPLDLSLPYIRADPDDSSLDPFLLPPSGNPSNGSRRPGGRRQRNPKNSGLASVSAAAATATLMEAQEFGEMMEHVDEVNFALDGLRLGQPVRIRRASLLSLLTICGTAQQRRLLRAQGMAKRIIDSILCLNFDDTPSTVAAAALFYVLASDAQDDHLLDSPSCIHFLLKILDPPMADHVEDKAKTIGYKLLGTRKPHIFGGIDKGVDSSSKAIISKVQEILLSCKEIRSGNGDDEGTTRPELNSKWIALLTMEKACLSTVSFEDTSEVVRKVGGNFKERLRELGGLDAIFNVLANCHSTMEAFLKHSSPSFSEIKEGAALQSLVLLLKCLKIMENATFLSKGNQNHLLEMKGKMDLKGLSSSFVGIILSAIKFLSGLSLLQRSSSIFNNEKSNSSKVWMEESERDNQDGTSTSDHAGWCEIDGDSHLKSIKTSHKRQKLSPSQSAVSGSHLEWTTASVIDAYSVKNRDCASFISCNGASSCSSGDSYRNGNSLRVKLSAIGSKVNSVRESNGWISIKGNGLTKDSGSMLKKSRISEDTKGHDTDSYDPFAFDEDELKPSKWELLAKKKETSQANLSAVTANRLDSDSCEDRIITTDHVLSHLTDDINHPSFESPSLIEQDSNLLEDCLLTSVKVLMNLTNDNPVGCQQIAACGGLDTLASLIINHFPSFDLCFPTNSVLKENSPSSHRSSDANHLNNKYLSDYELDFLVAILGLLVNLVEKDSRNRLRLATTRVSVDQRGKPESGEIHRDVIPFLCSIFLANQGAAEAAGEGRDLPCDDEDSLLQGEREAEKMIIEAYAALLLAFLSIESAKVREAIASCLPNHNLQVLVPVLERFVAFHLTLNMISPETHSAVNKVIESCKEP